jgi:hypothetical protein
VLNGTGRKRSLGQPLRQYIIPEHMLKYIKPSIPFESIFLVHSVPEGDLVLKLILLF